MFNNKLPEIRKIVKSLIIGSFQGKFDLFHRNYSKTDPYYNFSHDIVRLTILEYISDFMNIITILIVVISILCICLRILSFRSSLLIVIFGFANLTWSLFAQTRIDDYSSKVIEDIEDIERIIKDEDIMKVYE